jgi:hypothetical protein
MGERVSVAGAFGADFGPQPRRLVAVAPPPALRFPPILHSTRISAGLRPCSSPPGEGPHRIWGVRVWERVGVREVPALWSAENSAFFPFLCPVGPQIAISLTGSPRSRKRDRVGGSRERLPPAPPVGTRNRCAPPLPGRRGAALFFGFLVTLLQRPVSVCEEASAASDPGTGRPADGPTSQTTQRAVAPRE